MTSKNNIETSITLLVGKPLNVLDKKYLVNEYYDIQKIENVALKSKNSENDNLSVRSVNTKRPDVTSSIFVEALQSIKYFNKFQQ